MFLRYFAPEDTATFHHSSLESQDAEAILARGEKIALSKVGIYELELISGLSDSLANNILVKKEVILKKSRALPAHKQYQALELAHGIGEKSSEKFKALIAFE